MSFTARIVFGNIIIVVISVVTLTLLSLNNPSNILMNAIAGIFLLVGSSLILWFLSSKAFKPMATIVIALEKAAGGDLSARAEVDGSSEFARLATAFNTMMTDMNKAMRQFFSVADTVRDSVVLVRSTTDAMAAAAEDVATQASTIATASEEMSATS